MKMVWHIFRKDLRLLWWNALMFTAVQLGQAVMQWRADREGQHDEPLAAMLEVLVWLGGAFLTISVVQQDSLVGVRQDWLVRPIRRVDLLGAKLLFMGLVMIAPYGLIEFVVAVAHGLPWLESLAASVWASAFMVLVWYLPVMVLAVLTKSLAQAVGTAGMALALVVAISSLPGQHGHLQVGGSAVTWVPTLIDVTWTSCGLAALLAMQYRRRATMKARLMAVGVGLVVLFVIPLLPFSTAMALQEKVSPLAREQLISFHPEDVPIRPEPNWNRAASANAQAVWVPLRVDGLPADHWLKADQTIVQLVGRDGVTHDVFARYPESTDKKREKTYLALDVPESFLGEGMTVRIEAEVIGTVMRPVASATLPLTREWVPLGGLGVCWAGVSEFVGNGMAMCLQPRGGPAVCVEYTLASSTAMPCDISYAPWGNRFAAGALQRFPGFISPPANPSVAPYPLAAIDRTSHVQVRAYGVERHVRMRMVIPEIALGAWLAK